jgi:hypothetical protein
LLDLCVLLLLVVLVRALQHCAATAAACIGCVMQIGIAVMHLGRLYLASGWLSVLVAFQCVLLWFRLNYFSR